MEFRKTRIPDVLIIAPKIFGDDRGFFMETFRENIFSASGIPGPFIQENHSGSRKGVLRGLHYQIRQAQGKLVRVVAGVLQWARRNETLRIVYDQISNPTWARMLAETTGIILARGVDYIEERKGLYHLAGGGYASRLEWAQMILKLDPHRHEQTVKEILPALTTDFPTPAQRPLFSALNCRKLSQFFLLQLPDWQISLNLMMAIDI